VRSKTTTSAMEGLFCLCERFPYLIYYTLRRYEEAETRRFWSSLNIRMVLQCGVWFNSTGLRAKKSFALAKDFLFPLILRFRGIAELITFYPQPHPQSVHRPSFAPIPLPPLCKPPRLFLTIPPAIHPARF